MTEAGYAGHFGVEPAAYSRLAALRKWGGFLFWNFDDLGQEAGGRTLCQSYEAGRGIITCGLHSGLGLSVLLS